MTKTIWAKTGSMVGIGCAALGLAHLQSSALRTAPAAATAAGGVPSRSAREIGGVTYWDDRVPVRSEAWQVCYQKLTSQAAATANDPANVVNEGLFDR
jgi:hypothetical protein